MITTFLKVLNKFDGNKTIFFIDKDSNITKYELLQMNVNTHIELLIKKKYKHLKQENGYIVIKLQDGSYGFKIHEEKLKAMTIDELTILHDLLPSLSLSTIVEVPINFNILKSMKNSSDILKQAIKLSNSLKHKVPKNASLEKYYEEFKPLMEYIKKHKIRVEEAEPLIIRNLKVAREYFEIYKDANLVNEYNKTVEKIKEDRKDETNLQKIMNTVEYIGVRWKEKESLLIENISYSSKYFRIIKEEWKEYLNRCVELGRIGYISEYCLILNKREEIAEKKFVEYENEAEIIKYFRNFKVRIPAFEEYIISKGLSSLALNYIKSIIKKPFKMFEYTIKKDLKAKEQYEKMFGIKL